MNNDLKTGLVRVFRGRRACALCARVCTPRLGRSATPRLCRTPSQPSVASTAALHLTHGSEAWLWGELSGPACLPPVPLFHAPPQVVTKPSLTPAPE